MRWAGHVLGARRSTYKVLVGKSGRKRPLGEPRHRWEDTIKRILRKWDGGMDWIDLAQDTDRWRALIRVVMNLRVP
jgi:hypothetical protein